MKLKTGFLIKEMAGKSYAVSMGKDYNGFKGMISLSGSAPFYFELLKTEQTMDSLAQSAVEKFGISKEEAIKDLEPFIKKLCDAGVIEG